MDDFENKKVRRLRGMSEHAFDDNKIPPEKRGKKTCPHCKGQRGTYERPDPNKPAVFIGCRHCNLMGEVDA